LGEEEYVSVEEDFLVAEVLTSEALLKLLFALEKGPKTVTLLSPVVPRSTAHRLLRKLERVGLVKSGKGLSGKRVYYKLTTAGERVLAEVERSLAGYVRALLERCGERVEGGLAMDAEEFEKAVGALRLPVEEVARIAGLEKVERDGKTALLLKA